MTGHFLLVAGFAESVVTFRGELIASIQSCGLIVHVAAPGLGAGDANRKALEARGVVVHDIALRRTGVNPFGDLVLIWQLFRLMRRIRPEAVMGYTVKPVIYGALAAWVAGVPRRFALVTGLGYAFTGERKGLLTRLIQRLYAFALSRVTKVFFQNPDDLALFRQRGVLSLCVPAVVVNGSGVNVAAFPVQLLPGGLPRFLMIGRLLGDKGVREFVQAARMVRDVHPGVQFQLAGWIDENPDAIEKSELETWVSTGAIEFLGRLQDVLPAIAACTVYVLPSYREGTPRTVLEAMAAGRPIITTDAPGCRETVVDGDNGFLVPVKSIDALVAAMLRFVHDASLAPRMGDRSRQIAMEKYDVHKVNAVMLSEMGIAALEETKEPLRD
jgi:glycosyltransferase involved in cell wall biosynthesis